MSTAGDVECRLARLLLKPDTIASTVTGMKPAIEMLGGKLSTDRTRLHQSEEESGKTAAPREDKGTFQSKQDILFRNTLRKTA